MKWFWLLCVSALLQGCPSPDSPAQPGLPSGTLPSKDAAPSVDQTPSAPDTEGVSTSPDLLAPVGPPVEGPPAPPELISARSRQLIIRWEVGSPSRYTRLYQRPVCPLCDSTASGPTIGIGFDLGHASRPLVEHAWEIHPQLADLFQGIGFTGRDAIPVTKRMQHVITPFWMAEQVFDNTAVVQYYRVARRSFGEMFLLLNADTRGVLVSVVYNRGGSTNCASDMRREMCVIATRAVPELDYFLIAAQIRAMKRHWPNSQGLQDRREDEARLVELSLSEI